MKVDPGFVGETGFAGLRLDRSILPFKTDGWMTSGVTAGYLDRDQPFIAISVMLDNVPNRRFALLITIDYMGWAILYDNEARNL